ncbi:hypothetical protein CROQUDRAFT_659348 [Cronartium quercuum f. sp. fusiforme G11]|uniref:Uncharacterized protein n=1 Tax=Cronartium quercuum f. sp. fusiforme G11 TaxID=708437 RepID=A0A9P6NIU7_9BASI|nr:hypothetical protein CROQUDRAFT_659348 [Cronartium quercuum f. sp. fusiforme G11]
MVRAQGHPRLSAGNFGAGSSLHPPLSFNLLPHRFRLIGPDSPSPLPFHPFTSTSPLTTLPMNLCPPHFKTERFIILENLIKVTTLKKSCRRIRELENS